MVVGKRAVPTVCEEHDPSPTLFYGWQKQFFEKGAAAFAKDDGDELERENDALKTRLAEAGRTRPSRR